MSWATYANTSSPISEPKYVSAWRNIPRFTNFSSRIAKVKWEKGIIIFFYLMKKIMSNRRPTKLQQYPPSPPPHVTSPHKLNFYQKILNEFKKQMQLRFLQANCLPRLYEGRKVIIAPRFLRRNGDCLMN